MKPNQSANNATLTATAPIAAGSTLPVTRTSTTNRLQHIPTPNGIIAHSRMRLVNW
ncbi:MAG TPA: hypothetical protein VNH11_22345 [Pirellulales bacterium]|nr:hypothetical protein [Pirellulales bacterium]